jgi:hypothetical protein
MRIAYSNSLTMLFIVFEVLTIKQLVVSSIRFGLLNEQLIFILRPLILRDIVLYLFDLFVDLLNLITLFACESLLFTRSMEQGSCKE